MAIGAKRWILVSYNLPETNSTFNCLSQLWVPLMAQTASQNLASAICIDRISAVCRPKSYPHSPIGYTVGLAASAWLYAILLGSLAFLGVHDTELTTNCIMGTNVSDIFTQFTDFQDIVMTSLITIAYTLLIFKLNCKKTVEPKGVTNEVKKVNEIKVTMTLATNAFVYFLTHVLYSIGMHVVKNFDSQTAELAIPWIRNLPIIDSGINVFIYVWRSSEFRVAFLNLFKNSPFLHLNLVHNSSSLNKI